jgi:DNA-binding transcriptional regulator/RsmH inhibitor MraZ
VDDLRRNFDREMRRAVPSGFRDLLEAATEVHVKHGLKRGAESSRRRGEGPEWERLRSALMDLARSGYVAEEWTLEERF